MGRPRPVDPVGEPSRVTTTRAGVRLFLVVFLAALASCYVLDFAFEHVVDLLSPVATTSLRRYNKKAARRFAFPPQKKER